MDGGQDIQMNKNKMKQLYQSLQDLDKNLRFQKAVRHLHDALNLRPVRNDIENSRYKFAVFIYYIQINFVWNYILFLLSLAYPLLSFFEPANQYDINNQKIYSYKISEILSLILFLVDITMEIIHNLHNYLQSFNYQFFSNKKLLWRFLFITILIIDFIYYYSKFTSLRFARYIRPFLVLFYSKELRRSFKSIIESIRQIFQLFLFLLFNTLIFSIIGWKFVGDLDGAFNYDPFQSNFDNVLTASNILYSLISFDGYPECIIPSICKYYIHILFKSLQAQSQIYIIYFIIYLILYLFIFIPIPVAVVFEAFRVNRRKTVIMDRIKQREALLACFISLDFQDKKTIDYNTFFLFMSAIYLHKKNYIRRIKSLYLHLDINDQKFISLDQFFNIIDIFESNDNFRIPMFRNNKYWGLFRKILNKKLHLKKYVKNYIFESLMFVVLAVNCTVLIISQFQNEQIYDDIDSFLGYFYIFEFVLKIVGFGIEKYFQDNWNCFDFAMIIVSLSSNILNEVFRFLKSAKSAKTTKLIKLSKLNRIFKVFHTIKNTKLFNCLAIGAETLNQVQLLLKKIIMCIPLVAKLIPIILMVFYLYAFWGMETFNTQTFEFKKGSPYQTQFFGDFNNFQNSLLVLFQVMVQSNWSLFTYDYAYKFDNLYISMMFFDTFDMIISLILLSLIKGIVWEVFTVVDNEIKQAEIIQQQIEIDEINSEMNKLQQQKKINYKNIQIVNGIIEYKKILKNMRNISHKNSFIYGEGQVQNSPNFNDQIFNKIKNSLDNLEKINAIGNLNRIMQIQIQNNQQDFKNKQLTEYNQNNQLLMKNSIVGPFVLLQKIKSNIYKIKNIKYEYLYYISIIVNIQIYIYIYLYILYIFIFLYIYSQNSQKIQQKKSLTNSISSIQNDYQEFIMQIDDPNILQKEQIYELKLKIKSISYLKKIQYIEMRKFIQTQIQREIDFTQEFLLSDDPNSVKLYCKQLNEDIIEDSNQESENEEYIKRVIELQKEKNQYGCEEQSINSNFVLKKALLKDSNMDIIKKLEINYFQDCYGTFFNIFHDVNATPILKYESFLKRKFSKICILGFWRQLVLYTLIQQQGISLFVKIRTLVFL
ncbi:hypothetical protein IMG5_062980 [Ichthyophthirius multifiliis]|uniref:Ion transport domain-containing protein n=1 Tax=Ichthyophthirius multifiliis TaxID=5932 RepID=G0QP13_ICHMU|nr:hypothetical protein IMG5_062980 [Ichthyophthirius multifiliis]EGR33043.1 hypothetical protein IMG5_062980 [Ichthyophthirius multifiliis]|eukprot:XP_004037029.1 hypothetical protein IMG5_062980 [Ichthyophthirius multifiliis]